MRGDFLIVPNVLPEMMNVKYLATNQDDHKTKELYDDGTKEREAVRLKPDDIIFDLPQRSVD